MSIFVAWLVSTIVAIGVTIARFYTAAEALEWLLVPVWVVTAIIFFSMLYDLSSRVAKLYGYQRCIAEFVIVLIATLVTLILIFITTVAKIHIPNFVIVISCVITFISFCYFLYQIFDTVLFIEEREKEKKR